MKEDKMIRGHRATMNMYEDDWSSTIIDKIVEEVCKPFIADNKIKKSDRILDYLMQEEVIVVFDIDGVLAPYEFGELGHSACSDEEWEEYVINHKPYDNLKAVPQIKQFINDKGAGNIYVCSAAQDYEEDNKKNFVLREYEIPEQNIKFVRDKKDKIHFLQELAEKTGDEMKVAIVDDTVSTLDLICKHSNIVTVHVSSFFFYR